MARSMKTFAAAIDLCRLGYGEQAATLNRSLFEGMAVAHWIHANEEEACARFARASRFDRHLTIELFESIGWLSDDRDVDSAWRLADAELPPYRHEFGRFGDRLWTGHSHLRDLVRSIEDQWPNEEDRDLLWKFLDVVHRDNNQMLHSTAAGMARVVSRNAEGALLLRGAPASSHISKALYGANWIAMNSLTLVWDRFELPDRDDLDALLTEHSFLFIRLDPGEVRSVGRNDECPCGSGRKFKNCHWDQVHGS